MTEGELALTIPIVGITLSMAVAIVAIITWHRRNAQELEQRHKERMAAIDKGLDLPLEPLKVATARAAPRYLLRGLIWLGVGLAIVFGARELLDEDAASLGWIPVAVGAAYLLFYAVEGRRESGPRTAATAADADAPNRKDA